MKRFAPSGPDSQTNTNTRY